jgi:hypothetical protein
MFVAVFLAYSLDAMKGGESVSFTVKRGVGQSHGRNILQFSLTSQMSFVTPKQDTMQCRRCAN